MTTKRISFALVAAALMFILIAGLNSHSSVRAGGESAPQLEGSWVDEVTFVSGLNAGTTIKSLSTYSRGGGLVTLPVGGVPPPLRSSDGHGTWIHLGERGREREEGGGRAFTATIVSFVNNPAGQIVATVKTRQDLTVSAGGDEYNGNSSFDVFDPAGNLIPGFSGCATVHGRRINVEPPNACP